MSYGGNEHICFTAIPYEGFDALLGTSTTTASSSTDRRKERLQLALKLAVVVGGVVAIGLAFGFSIAAIVRHAKHHHHHHKHHDGMTVMHQQQQHHVVDFDAPLPEASSSFWGVKNHPSLDHHKDRLERPARRHADGVTGTTKGGFWKTSKRQPRLRTHARPQTMQSQPEQDWDDFFPLEEEEVENEQDDFFPVELVDGDDYYLDDDYDGYDDYDDYNNNINSSSEEEEDNSSDSSEEEAEEEEFRREHNFG